MSLKPPFGSWWEEQDPALGNEAGIAARPQVGSSMQPILIHSAAALPLATASGLLEHRHRAASLRPWRWTTSLLVGTSHMLTPGQCVVETCPLRLASPAVHPQDPTQSPAEWTGSGTFAGGIHKYEESGVLASTSMPWDILDEALGL